VTVARASFWEYVKRAFHIRYPVKGLGPISVNKWLLFGAAIVGFAFHPVWLLALAAEVLYLYSMATNPRFRNIIDAERIGADRAGLERRVGELRGQLDRKTLERFEGLVTRCRDILGISSLVEISVAPLEEAKRSGMEQLIFMYLQLLVGRATIDAHFPGADRETLSREIDALRKEAARPGISETLRKTKEGTLDIARKRLENLDRAVEQRAVIDSELERIEQQVELIREDTAMGREPGALTSRIDQVVGTLGETSDWLRKNADLIGDIGEEKPRDVAVFLEPRRRKETE